MPDPHGTKRGMHSTQNVLANPTCVEGHSLRQKRQASIKMRNATHRLVTEHIAADAPIGLSTADGKTPPTPTSDTPGHFNRASTDAYLCHIHHLLDKCRKRSSLCAQDVGLPSLAVKGQGYFTGIPAFCRVSFRPR